MTDCDSHLYGFAVGGTMAAVLLWFTSLPLSGKLAGTILAAVFVFAWLKQ